MSSADVSFHVEAFSSSHSVTSETLNKQKRVKGKPINISVICIQVILLDLKNGVKLTQHVSYMSLTLNSTKLTQGVARITSSGPDCVAWESHIASFGRIFNNALEGSYFPPFWPLLKFLHLNINLGKQYSSIYAMSLNRNSEGKYKN